MAELRFDFLLSEDGKLRWGRILVAAVLFILFLAWRVSTQSVFGSDRILASIREELIDDYRQSVLKKTGYYGEEIAQKARAEESTEDMDFDSLYYGDSGEGSGAEPGETPAWQQLRDMEVEFSNVSMSAPLLSWSANEDVIVRFDYTLRANGEVQVQEVKQYRWVERKRGMTIWDSGPVRYYLNYF